MKDTIAGISMNPSAGLLRQFGLGSLLILGAIGGVFWFRGHTTAAVVAWGAGAGIGLAGLLCPRALRWVFVGLTLAGLPIGLTVSAVLLAAIYLVVLTPIGCIMRLAGRDAMSRRFDGEARSYWTPRPARADRDYFRQF